MDYYSNVLNRNSSSMIRNWSLGLNGRSSTRLSQFSFKLGFKFLYFCKCGLTLLRVHYCVKKFKAGHWCLLIAIGYKRSSGDYSKYLSGRVGFHDVEYHIVDCVVLREIHDGHINVQLFEDLAFELGKCDRIRTRGCQRFVDVYVRCQLQLNFQMKNDTYQGAHWAGAPLPFEAC